MKMPNQSGLTKRAFTLLEMTVVIMIMLALLSTGMFVNKKMDEWKIGRQAAETLNSVYSAQRMFIADNPTRLVSSITAAEIIPYLQNGATSLPTAKSMEGAPLTIKFTDPLAIYFVDSGGIRYDPSGSYEDLIWDVGK
jgi:prepilin-type N-terminal cleavage/methylation domain-containing protein